jgi:HAD superfamily hydrolase (TIGR01509 family)
MDSNPVVRSETLLHCAGQTLIATRRRRAGPSPLVIFDIGSTLVRASSGHVASRVARELALTPRQVVEVNRAFMTKPFAAPTEVADWLKYYLGLSSDHLDKVIEGVWADQEEEAMPADGAQAMLRDLAGAGMRLALLSNIWQPYMTSVRKHFGALFDELIPPDLQSLSFRTGVMKPDHSVFRGLLNDAHVEPDEAVMVGDSYTTDLKPALQLGMKTIWVLQRTDREVDSLAAVLNGSQPRTSWAVSRLQDISPGLVLTLLGRGPPPR